MNGMKTLCKKADRVTHHDYQTFKLLEYTPNTQRAKCSRSYATSLTHQTIKANKHHPNNLEFLSELCVWEEANH